jgi:hypothetical protein
MSLKVLRRFLPLLLAAGAAAGAAAPAVAEEAPIPPAEAEAERLVSQHGFRVEIAETEAQDPVVFTEIRPFVAEEVPVRLPDDQALE